MKDTAELREIAERLKREEPFFAKHDINALQAFIRDNGHCKYCGRDLFESYDLASAVDHLLPKARYPHLEHEASNLVASCGECNSIKANWNPTEGDVPDGNHTGSITCEDRKRFAKKAEDEIKKRKAASPDWRSMFDRARDRFRAAAAEYEGDDC